MRLTQKRLKELLHYAPTIGVFTWRVSRRNGIKIGDIAGTLSHGYVAIRICGIKYLAQRLAWFYMKGVWPTFEIDHRDNVRHNNRWKNLRDKTHAINLQNQRKAHRDNRTGKLGVRSHYKGFQANIALNGKNHSLGTYPTIKQAHKVYFKAKRKLHEGCTI